MDDELSSDEDTLTETARAILAEIDRRCRDACILRAPQRWVLTLDLRIAVRPNGTVDACAAVAIG